MDTTFLMGFALNSTAPAQTKAKQMMQVKDDAMPKSKAVGFDLFSLH